MCKYSIIMPYLRRFQHLNNTLVSFEHWYKDRSDYELIIVEDTKNQRDPTEHLNLLSLLDEYEDLCPINHIEYTVDTYNPAGMFNLAAKEAKGEYLILSNPECFHEVDILSGLDKCDLNDYIVCACKSIYNQNIIENFEDLRYEFDMFYVHSIHYPRKIHFCTCIKKDTFNSIGGFDEEYMNWIGYEDTDLVQKIKNNKIPMIIADDLVVLHQSHSRQYNKNYNHQALYEAARKYYNNKWGLNE